MGLFEDSYMESSIMPDKPFVLKRKSKTRKTKVALRQESAENIFTELGGLPKHGENYTIISNGGFDCICYLNYIIKELKVIDILCLATWIINRDNCKQIFDYLDDGSIKSMVLILSNRTRQLRKQDWGFIIEGMKDRRVKIKIPNTHAKLFTCANYDKNSFITVEGSGNWNENKRIENYSVSNDKELFLFHQKWMNEILRN